MSQPVDQPKLRDAGILSHPLWDNQLWRLIWMDSRTALITAAALKFMPGTALLQERAKEAARDPSVKYPRQLERALRDSGNPIDRLPVLILEKNGDYIDFLKSGHMSDRVMRFTTVDGRPGIAFHAVVKHQHKDEDVAGVFTVFKRYAEGRRWVVGSHGPIDYALGSHSSGSEIDIAWLEGFVQGHNPEARLV